MMKPNIFAVITLALLALAAIAVPVLRHYKKGAALESLIRALLPALTTEAEKLFGGGTGQIKLSWVIDQVYQRLPEQLASRVSVAQIEKLVDAVLGKLRPLWAARPEVLMDAAVNAALSVWPETDQYDNPECPG